MQLLSPKWRNSASSTIVCFPGGQVLYHSAPDFNTCTDDRIAAFEDSEFSLPIDRVPTVTYVIANWLADGMLVCMHLIPSFVRNVFNIFDRCTATWSFSEACVGCPFGSL